MLLRCPQQPGESALGQSMLVVLEPPHPSWYIHNRSEISELGVLAQMPVHHTPAIGPTEESENVGSVIAAAAFDASRSRSPVRPAIGRSPLSLRSRLVSTKAWVPGSSSVKWPGSTIGPTPSR